MSEYIILNNELYHHGVKGMKWGVRKSNKVSGIARRIRQKRKDKIADMERSALVDDAKKVTYKAPSGKHAAVIGGYYQKRGGLVYPSMHIVNDRGKVKMSYIRGKDGDRYVAAGKDYISKLDLNQFFTDIENMRVEYDVYD